MSSFTLSRMFHEHLGIGFPAYQTLLQINAVRRMLVQTDLPVNEICTRCGFNNVRSFNRSFQRYVGCTAGEYRKKIPRDGVCSYETPFVRSLLLTRYEGMPPAAVMDEDDLN
ncbi:MAG: helix-turn-helix transcriptional regulator [Clostridia bacterium]|nr:helix-turn-helix transcriptional regulator [Clostridia bacterium]